MGYSPDEFYRMSLNDIFIMIEAFSDNEMAEMNRMRHLMWASLAAFGGKQIPTPQRLMPLPIDNESQEMSLDDFNNLRRLYNMIERPKAKA